MGILIILLIIAVVITGLASSFISQKVYKMMKEKGNEWAITGRNLTFIAVFLIILGLIFLAFLYTVPFGR